MKSRTKLIVGSLLILSLAAVFWAKAEPSSLWRAITAGKEIKVGEVGPRISKIRTLRHESTVTAVGWSPDGRMLGSYSQFGTLVTLWRPDGTRLRDLDIYSGRGPYLDNSILFLAGGRELLTPYGHSPSIRPTPAEDNFAFTLWNVEMGTVVRNIELTELGSTRSIHPLSLALSSDGKILACIPVAINAPVTLYATNDWRKIGSIPIGGERAESDGATSASFSPDGTLLAIGLISGQIKLVDLRSSDTTQNLINVYVPRPSIGVNKVAFSPNGLFLGSGARSQSDQGQAHAPIKVLRLADRQFVASYPGYLAPVRQFSWSADSRYLAAATGDGTVRIFMPSDPSVPGTVIEFDSPPSSTAFSPDGQLLAVAAGDDVIIFALAP